MANTNTNLIATATEAGRKAFEDGKNGTPCQNRSCMDLIRDNDGQAIVIMKAWQSGWDRANVAAPVPGM